FNPTSARFGNKLRGSMSTVPTGQPELTHGPELRTAPARRRRTRRRFAIALAVLAVLIGAAYLLIPWWMPTSWLAGRIAQELSAALGAPVEVGGVTLDWNEGVVIRSVALPHSQTRGGTLLRIHEIRCELTPMRWLSGGGL